MGVSYKNIGADKKARDLLRAGMERWPRDPDFYLHLGSLEIKAGNKEEGERLNNIARMMSRIESDPTDADARADLGRLFFGRGMFSDAAEYLRQALSVAGSRADIWTLLGECYTKAGQYPAAVDAFKQATRLEAADPRPHRALAQVFQLLGRFDESRAAKEVAGVLEGGQGELKDASQGARYVKYLLSIGKTEDAETSLNEMLDRWPDSLDLKVILGRVLLKRNQNKDAVLVLKEVAQEKEKWAEPRILLAMAYQRLGDKMSALAEGQLATRLAPKSHTAHKVLGDILREQGKFSMAENAYETAEHLKPTKKEK
jgi:Flp pilus assembly protein TadD